VRVVWEAHVVPEKGAFDFWLAPMKVLVEVDGVQHTSGTMHGMDATERMLRDQHKDAAAAAEGYHVARLHVLDHREGLWVAALGSAVDAAKAGEPARAHRTPSYPQLLPVPV
jgi:hypothetical protein